MGHGIAVYQRICITIKVKLYKLAKTDNVLICIKKAPA